MTRIQLTINGTTRWIDSLHYEYFNPVCKSEEKYRATLQKNFPYDFGDDRDLFPYSTVTLPTLTTDALAKRLSDDAKRETRSYDPSFRSTSIFRERKSQKDIYYDRLTELRYNKGLDRDIIPNIHNLYDMETRPSNSRDFPDIGRVTGGIFEFEFDSTDDDDFFYQWLLSGTMNNGEMVFYKGDNEEQFIKIKFWDCYCTEFEERMSSVDYSPMKMKIRISPAITENRGIKHEKSWKVTEIVNKPFKPEPYAPPIPLVTAVKGKATASPSEEVEYRVTEYNLSTVDNSDRNRVKWVVKVNGKEIVLKEHGEVLKLLIKKEWVGEEIAVMPYLQSPNEKISIKTTIQGLIDVYTQSDKYLFSLEPNEEHIAQKITAKELYKKGIQWFSPMADNYLKLIKMSPKIFSYEELKHFSWKDVIDFAEEDRIMLAYRTNGAGDWKAVGKPGDGYLLVTVSGMPYWTDAIGQIPFTLNEFRNCLKYYGNYDLAEKETLRIGRKFADGNLFGKADDSNSYDNEMIKRAIKWAKSRYKILGIDQWNRNAVIEFTNYPPNCLSKPL